MKQLLVFLLLLCAASVSAQDVIVKKDGSTVVCRVVELTATEITYKKWSDLNGSNYVMDRSLASAINYESGKKVNLSEVENLYQPNNQNDGVQRYNDRALLALDASTKGNPLKKARKLKTVAYVGGGVLAGLGIVGLINSGEGTGTAAGVYLGSSVVWTTCFLIAANQQRRKAKMLQISSLYQYNIPLSNGSSLSLGTDLLSDHSVSHNTLGLGLRYNF